ncbi:MAG: HEAT repeat protein, partial [Planctomycetota bacterium]
ELLRRSFTGQWILRDNAYAILAIIEREDDQLRPILDERHAEALLAGLRTGDHLVRGTCAAALAGIGFRSSRPLETTWLDNEVTGTMVAAVSGKDYHSDFSALQPRVLRRLRLVSGADFGTDGPRWARWWVDSRLSFYAHRAYLNVPVGGEATLELHYRGTGRAAGTFSLLGGDVKAREAAERAASAEQFFLTRSECADLISLLEREGALSPKHQPGQRGSMGPGQREIEVVIGGHGKKFVFGKGRSESWFEKIDSAMTDLRSRNRWQRFPNMVRYSNARDFWEEESGWWIGEHSDVERGLRMKSLVFNSIKQMPPSRRTLALRELEESYEVYGVAESDDLMFILDLLRDEGFYAERAELLVQLAMRCVQIGDVPGGPESIDREHAKVLIDLLLARFDRNAIKVVGSIARACDAEFMAELAEGERPLLRAVAAAELSRTQTPESIALLMGMLDDEEVVVEAAAVIALGELNAEEARTELLLRARLAPPMVRAAALRAIGMLGGEYVLEALVLGVSDPNLEVKSGAARGLVSLRDPQSAPILISLMRQSRGQEIYEIAREGLIGLGDGARADLLRVVKSPAHQARRECAMLLSGMGEPAVVPALISMFDQKSQDEELAFELAVLTCYDPRQTEAPASAWVTWYDGVTHDDSLVWFLAELERRGVPVSVSASFRGNGPGTREAALFLLEVIAGDSDYLIERARRELSRMLGADLGEFPKKLEEQGLWLAALRDTILERFES